MLRFNLETFTGELRQTAALLLEGLPERARGDAARAIQELAEVALAKHRGNAEAIACKAGCGHCCIVNVAVLAPETDAIMDYLRRKSGPTEQRRLAERAEELFHLVRGLDDEERIMLRRPCLFLDETACCGIYPVRPLLCRALTSTDPERCREAIAMLALGQQVPILANTFQQELFNQAFVGLAAALEQVGLDARSQPLTAAIRERLVTLGSTAGI